MATSLFPPLLFLAPGATGATRASDDWMYVSAIGAAMLLFTLVVALWVRRPR